MLTDPSVGGMIALNTMVENGTLVLPPEGRFSRLLGLGSVRYPVLPTTGALLGLLTWHAPSAALPTSALAARLAGWLVMAGQPGAQNLEVSITVWPLWEAMIQSDPSLLLLELVLVAGFLS